MADTLKGSEKQGSFTRTAWCLSKGKSWDKQDLNPCLHYNWVSREALAPWGILIHWHLFPPQIIKKFGPPCFLWFVWGRRGCGGGGVFVFFFEWTIPNKHDFERVACFDSVCLSGYIGSWAAIHMPCAHIPLMARFSGGMTFQILMSYIEIKEVREC